jgi:hypothetical protein
LAATHVSAAPRQSTLPSESVLKISRGWNMKVPPFLGSTSCTNLADERSVRFKTHRPTGSQGGDGAGPTRKREANFAFRMCLVFGLWRFQSEKA